MHPRSPARRLAARLCLLALLTVAGTACDDAGDDPATDTGNQDTADTAGDTTPDPDTGAPNDTTEPGDTDDDIRDTSADDTRAGDTSDATDTTDPADAADTSDTDPGDTRDTADPGDTADASDADPGDTTDVDSPTPGIDCSFDGSTYNAYAVDNSPVQVASADGTVCVRLERKLTSDDPFLICKACDYTVLAAWIGHDDATHHQDDPGAFGHDPTHHNWNDSYHVTTHGVRYTLTKAWGTGGGEEFTHTLTGVDAADGTTVVFGPVELVPHVP